jgi:hypothetical protein
MSDQDTEEPAGPTLQDVMNALADITINMSNLNERLLDQESAMSEIQSRVSILYDKESSDDEGSTSTNKEKKSSNADKSRKKSMFQRNVDETSTLSERHTVVVQRQTPNHSHIYLQSTDLGEYAQFVNKWFDWEIQHGIKLEPALIVARNVRNQLMYNNDKSETDFNSLTPTTFCSMMAQETKVFSKVQFAETLRNAMRDVKVLFWDNVRPSTHEKFFQGILRRQKLFLRTFQIMMEANKIYCPELEGKEFGLGQIFLDSIDRNYNKYILAEIPKVKDYNYKKLEDFLDAYVTKAKSHFEVSRSVRMVPYGGADFKINNHKPYSSSSSSNSNTKPYTRGSSDSQTYQRQQVNFVDITTQEDVDEKESFTDDQLYDQLDSDNSDIEYDEKQLDSIPDGYENVSQPVEDQQELNALENSRNSTPSVRGCVNYALYGKCFSGDSCKNVQGHNERIAEQTREWMVRKLTTTNVKAKPASMNSGHRDRGTREFNNVQNTSRILDEKAVPNKMPNKIVQRDRSSNRDRE